MAYSILSTSYLSNQSLEIRAHPTSTPTSPFIKNKKHTMVRLKNRYLLLEFLYQDSPSSSIPTPPNPNPKETTTDITHQTHLQIHAPTPNTVTPGLLARTIKDEVSNLFGDWGVGRLGTSRINGTSLPSLPFSVFHFIPHERM